MSGACECGHGILRHDGRGACDDCDCRAFAPGRLKVDCARCYYAARAREAAA